jgi:hypothetical protein
VFDLKKHLQMKKLLDNDYFRNLLHEVDEDLLLSTGIYFIPFSKQQESLLSNKEFFHEFLSSNYPDFGFSETEDEFVMDNESALFLTTQTRESKLNLYQNFITSYAMIEDLMCLDLDERQELIFEFELAD